MSEESKYIYSVDELDRMIEKINKGITPMMTDQMALEVKIRLKELQDELFDETDDPLDDEDIKAHQEMLRKHVEKKKREATKKDVLLITLTDQQKEDIRVSMETSIVRKNPNSAYNISDEELYSSEEKRVIFERLSKLKNCYYNQTDFVNAMKIIADAVDYSLTNDYPWLTKDEAYKQFHEGKIKFTFCNVPKLFINYTTQITDPEILRGVLAGKVTIKKKEEQKSKNKEKSKPTFVSYNIMSDSEYDSFLKLHQQGCDTLISSVFKKNSMFNRLSMPQSSITYVAGTNNKQNTEPLLFDWSTEGAGERYYNMINNIKTRPSDIIDFINELNGKELNRVVKSNTIDFLQSLKKFRQSGTDTENTARNVSNSINVNPAAAQLEQDILQAIRASNPNV